MYICHPRTPTYSSRKITLKIRFLLSKFASNWAQGFESQAFLINFGPFFTFLKAEKNLGSYLCLKLSLETKKTQNWKIFCSTLGPTVLCL